MVSSSSPSRSQSRRGPPPVFSKGNTRKLPCDGLVGGVPAGAVCAEAGPGKTPSIAIAHSMRKEFQLKELRSEEHTSELQSRLHLVCRLLLEKKKENKKRTNDVTPQQLSA